MLQGRAFELPWFIGGLVQTPSEPLRVLATNSLISETVWIQMPSPRPTNIPLQRNPFLSFELVAMVDDLACGFYTEASLEDRVNLNK